MSLRTLVILQGYDPSGPTLRTFYLTSGTAFITTPSETPASQSFDAALSQPLDVRRRVQSIRGGAVLPSIGDLRIHNQDGAYDAWLGYAFDGRSLVVRMGPESGAYPSAYPVVFSGTIDRLDVQGDEIVIRVRDAVAALDRPLGDTLFAGDNVAPDGLEGGAELEGRVKPLVFGVVKNVPLVPVNTAKLIYQVSDSAATPSEVYDSGVPLSLTEPGSPVTVGAGALTSITAGLVNGARRGGIAYAPLINTYVVGGQGAGAGDEAIYTSSTLTSWTARSSVFDRVTGTSDEFVAHLRWFDDLALFVAVGGEADTAVGYCATSPTGATWTTRTLGGGFTTATASCVSYGNGRLVVGSDANGVLRYSDDSGATWTTCTATGLPGTINDIWYADGLFVLVGSGGIIQTSIDGATWIARTSGTASNLTAVRYIDGRWIVTGNSGTVATSPDAVSWIARLDGTGTGKDDIADDGYRLLSIGGSSSPTLSDDRGSVWATTTAPGITARAAVFDGSRIRLFGGGSVVSISTAKVYANAADLENDSLEPVKGSYGYLASASGSYVRLGSPPFGTVTADVTQGATAADRTAGQLFTDVLVRAGYVAADWAAADITALDTADNSEVGLFIDDETTVAEALDALATTVGAWWGVDADGDFRIAQLTAPSGSSTFSITANDIRGRLERIASSDPLLGIPSYRTSLRYVLADTLTMDGTVVEADAGVQTTHLLAEATVEDSLYTTAADAQAEATRRQTLRGTARSAYRVTVSLEDYASVDLGDVGTLTHPRFGLSGGALVRVLGVEPDARNRSVTLTLWK